MTTAVEKVKVRLLRDANTSVRQLTNIAEGLTIHDMELSQVRAAARQAEQAAAELNKLAGVLEVEFMGQ